MRNSIVFLVLIVAGAFCHGQSPAVPAGSEWSHVEALTAGTHIHVATKHHGLNCRAKRADEDGLVCLKGSSEVDVPRADIVQVEIISRGKSAALAAGLGAGLGFAVDAGLSKGLLDGGKIKGSVAVASGAAGAAILAPIGYFGGWIHHTIYTAAP